jgi:ribosomal protein L29
MKRTAYLLIVTLFTSCLDAQNKSTKLTIQEMHEDIDFYFDTLKTCNPSLNQLYTESQLDSLKLALKTECSIPMSADDFNYLIAKTNKFTNLHSGINIDYILTKPIKDSLFFPVVDIRKSHIYLDNRKILSINGKSVETILSDIDNRISWEYNERDRIYMTNKRLTSFLQNKYDISPPYICEIYSSDKEIQEEIIPTVTWNDFFIKANPAFSKLHKENLNSIFFEKDSIAVLFYNGCNAYTDSMKTYFDKYTKSFFKTVKDFKIKYLFIDVSQNGGGTFLSHNYILRFLNSKPYTMLQSHYFSKPQIEEMYNQNLKIATEKLGLKTKKEVEDFEANTLMFSSMKKRIADGIYNFSQPYNKPGKEDGFKGKVFLVIGRTFSAAYDFSEIIKRADIAVLVGEMTGQRMPYGGMGKRGKLPHSNVVFHYSSTFFTVTPSITNSEGFLEPDIPYALDHPFTLFDYQQIIRLSEKDKNR